MIALAALVFFAATRPSAAQVITPCKECSLGFCQQTPNAVPGRDQCNDSPQVTVSCTWGIPGGLSCGPTVTIHCETGGGVCMNWMEFVWVQGELAEPGCDEVRPRSLTPAPPRFPTALTRGLRGTA